MSTINLTSKYLFNEIPGGQKKIDEFGYKACKLSLAKKWQFSLPDTVFLSGDLVKEIFEKKNVPAEILSHFNNKLLAIRPSPVIGRFMKNEPFIYIGLDDQSYDALQQRVGLEKALEIYKTLEDRGPEAHRTKFNYGSLLMAIENFKDGWMYYEYRWKLTPFNKVIWPFESKAVWKGEKGKRVALWKEQGIGDDIIFLGLVAEVNKMCSTLSVYVDPRLRSLCMRAMPEINFVEDLETLQSLECDYHLPLGSVPGLIRNDISDFDRTVRGYLKADPHRVELIRNELNLEGKTVIGVSWKSYSTAYKTKSVQLRDMERLFSGLNVVLVNLQYGDVEDEIKKFKEETGIEVVQCASVDNKEDLDGLAALIEVCDLVISTSNATIHLAGALAKETWVLLHYVSIYYWLVERTDSIWYPSLTLYRQPKLNDWNSVYGSIRKDLQRKLTKA